MPVIFQEYMTDPKNLSGKPVDIKQHNQRLVISLLERKKILSAGELSSLTALSKTTISKILAELCKQDIVCSAGKGESTTEGGKKPELFRINAELAATVVLSMYRKNVLDCAVIDLGREILYREKHTLNDGLTYQAGPWPTTVWSIATAAKSSIRPSQRTRRFIPFGRIWRSLFRRKYRSA